MAKQARPMVPRHFTLMERVRYYTGNRFGKVLHGQRCLGWTASGSNGGYPRITKPKTRKPIFVARIVLEHALGRPLKPKMFALHHCDHPGCIEPAHLYEGTAQQNVADMIGRGRRWQNHGSVHPNAVIDEKIIEQIWARRGKDSQRAIAANFGVSQGDVSCIFNGKRWAHTYEANFKKYQARADYEKREAAFAEARRRAGYSAG